MFSENIIAASIILLIGYFLKTLLLRFVEKVIPKEEGRPKTLGHFLQNALTTVIVFITLSTALSKIGVDITPLIASAGVLGLAVGFGSQTLIKDVVTGFFILSENQYNIGDEVEIAGVKGLVREIKLRTTTLVDENGTVHIIPNSTITRVSKYPKKS